MDSQNANFSDSLLIVGAGAHEPYNMPTSTGLTAIIKEMYATKIDRADWTRQDTTAAKYKARICSLIIKLGILNQNPSAYPVVLMSGEFVAEITDNRLFERYVIREYDKFLGSFCGARVYSIDKYLSTLPKLKDEYQRNLWAQFGKLTIAYIIHQKEIEQPYGTQKDDWIDLLINQHLADDPTGFLNSPPTIVTFNYDRLFEKAIYQHLIEQHRFDENAAKDAVMRIPILHVYGVLGDFALWSEVDDSFYKSAMENIKVIGEERDKTKLDEAQKKVKSAMIKARKIYFLGYGFDSINNDFLFGSLEDGWRGSKIIRSTNVGIDAHDVKPLERVLHANSFQLHTPVNCYKILREVWPLSKPVPTPRAQHHQPVSNYRGSLSWMGG